VIPLRDNIPTRRTPIISWLFIVANVFGFYLEISSGGGFDRSLQQTVLTFGLRPVELMRGVSLSPVTPISDWLTLFTSMFMHGGWMHLIGNMLYMWIFADNVEDAMGRARFVVFYVLSGLFAAGAQILFDTQSEIPMVGASGAIAGVLGGYVILYPRAKVLSLVPFGFFSRLVEVPAMVVLGLWFVIQLVQAPFAGPGGGTAFLAHIGGFVFGMLAIKGFARDHKTPRTNWS
jgi:membrane associated rhomboid family serine protease